MRRVDGVAHDRTVTDDFGIELRRIRTQAGISLAGLARRVHYSKGYLSKIETGAMPPSEYLARRCDAALDANGALVGLVREISPPETAATGDGEAWLMSPEPDGESGFFPTGRRNALFTGAASLVMMTIRQPATRVRAGAEHLAPSFRAMYEQTRILGQTTSPHVMLPLVIAQAQALGAQITDRKHGLDHQLAVLAARNAEYAGWMAQESGDNRAALWWIGKAVEIDGGLAMATYAVVRQAVIALSRGQPRDTVVLAARAQADHRTPARIRGLAAQQEGLGHALAGDYGSCMRALDNAARLLRIAEAEPQDEPVLGPWAVRDSVAIETGCCLYDLGRSHAAVAVLDREIAEIPRTALRARVRYGTVRALAYASVGEVDHACTLTNELLGDAVAVDSATARADLRRLAATLRRWHNHPGVRELSPSLTSALRG